MQSGGGTQQINSFACVTSYHNPYGQNNLCSEGLRNNCAEREAGVVGASSTLEDEEYSEYEDHVSVNSESGSELEEEDEIDPQSDQGPASQQPAPGTARQQPEGGQI